MLNVIEYGKDEYDFPALLVLGCFDAIHVGHRDLIKKAKLQAKINGLDLGVMLFRDGKGGKTVYSFEERLAILEEFNVKFVLVIDFTDEFKNTSPEDFLHTVEDKVNVKAYMSGKDFRFGAKAKGKSSTLKNYAEDEDNGVWYMSVKDVTVNDEKVSTTQIKELLESGNIAQSNELLGSEFCVCGEVVKGAGRGASQVGYPTVNINYPENKFKIKQGVYVVKSNIGETEYYGIANYGNCPTFGDERIALEVHFEGFSGDLYGETLNIRFVEYVRDIVAFASAEELKAQLDADKTAISAVISAKKAKEAAADGEASAQAAEAVPVVEEIQVTPEEYKELDSGFNDIVEEPVEEAVQTEEADEEAAEQAVEETTVTEQVTAEVTEEAEPEQAVEEATVEPVFVAEEQPAEQPAEEEEAISEPEQIVEEVAVEPVFVDEVQLAEQTLEVEEAISEPEQTVEEVAVEPVFVDEEGQSEEEYEVVEGGFDDIVEEPIEELVQAEEPAEAEETEVWEEVAETIETEAQPEEPAEVTEPEEPAETAEEEQKPEEGDGEANVD